jgi:hypothetical protein
MATIAKKVFSEKETKEILFNEVAIIKHEGVTAPSRSVKLAQRMLQGELTGVQAVEIYSRGE